jgi:signal transduction histidine kinase
MISLGNNKSIRWKLLLTMLGLCAGLLIILTFIQIISQRNNMHRELNSRITVKKENLIHYGLGLAENLDGLVENLLASYNLSNLSLTLQNTVTKEESLLYIILMDSSQTAWFHTLYPKKEQEKLDDKASIFSIRQIEPAIFEYQMPSGIDIIECIVPIQVSTAPWGVLRLGFSLEKLKLEIEDSRNAIFTQIKLMIFQSILVAVLFLGVAIIIVIFVSRKFSTPLINLKDAANQLAKGNYVAASDIWIESEDEVGLLTRAFVEMSYDIQISHQQIEDYSKSLEHKVEERTIELKIAYEDLKRSQEQLIQAEKMASLGQLVAGVAHEINTPIGIGVTASSHFADLTAKIINDFDSRHLNKNSLKLYFENASEAADLILTNLIRAAELVENFKLVSADQTSQEHRLFNIKEYIDSIVVSLRPKLKQNEPQIQLNCPDNLEIHSYPGAFAQILTNFIMNSLIHAFDKLEPGIINIDVLKEEKNILLIFSDNGKGISKKNLKKVFDPFFTTRRGEGGTGLGMNIVYNIVHKTLKGKITCESELEKGTSFIITIPIKIG